METLVTLEPRDDPNEILMNGLEQRKPLELRRAMDDQELPTLVLGRGSHTGIGDNSIGSDVLKLSLEWVSGETALKATLSRDSIMCRVHVNGQPFPRGKMTIYLNSGDIISLDGLRYEYRVHISELSGSASAPGSDPLGGDLGLDSEDFWDAASQLASPQETKSELGVNVPATDCNQLADEIQCSVCLEIQVNSRSIHPCGHSVCAICITKLTDCPQCRVKMNSHIPNMQLDSLICKLVSIPSLLDEEDVKTFHERKKNAKVFPAVDFTPMSGTKRRRSASSRSARSVRTPPGPPGMVSGGRVVSGGRRGVVGFAFGDADDEFYMPPHLGPEVAAAATARAVSNAAAPASRPQSYIRRGYPTSGMADHMMRQRLLAREARAHSVQRRGQVASSPRQAGTSLENAISID